MALIRTDPADILSREKNKRPCVNFQRTGSCQYGASCRYSHLTREELVRLQMITGKKISIKEIQRLIEPVRHPLQALFEVEMTVRLRREKNLSSLLPQGCNIYEVPPSIQRSLDNQYFK